MAEHAPVVAEVAERARDRLLGGLTTFQRDALLAAALGALALGLHLGFAEDGLGALVRVPGWVAYPVLVGEAATLAWRRTRPDQVMGVVGGFTAAYYFTGQGAPAAVVLLVFALYAITAYGTKRADGAISLVVCLVFMTASFVIGAGWAAVATASYVLSAFVFGVAWALGDATRTRAALTDELRRRNAQLAALRDRERDELVAEERRRIARELHDVVSHTVSVVVVQAAAAQRVAGRDPDAAVRALATIEGAGRDAMAELRRMLGLLRDVDGDVATAPAPDLAATATLLEELRATGMPLRVEGDLDQQLPAGIALTVHRVVQEGLTNVLRHAEDVGEVLVRLVTSEDELEVEVVDDGRPAGFTEGAGAGLVGIRERVALHGGAVTARPGQGRGFRLHVRLPLRAGDRQVTA